MGFRFTNDKVCVIEIEGVRYRVTIQKGLIDRLRKAQGAFEKMKSAGADIDAAAAVFDTAIDGILGRGSAKRIFAGRFTDLNERFAVLQYIYGEITDFTGKLAGGKNVRTEAEGSGN